MPRRFRPENHCLQCRMRKDLCYCALIEPIETHTRVVVLMHRYEENKSTGTVRLMKFLLPGAEVHMFGGRESPPDLSSLDHSPGTQLLLFPAPAASMLDSDFAAVLTPPVTLVIPDGTWYQAKRLANHRLLGLQHIPRVRLPAGAPSEYRLRKNQAEDGLCTLEALARALGVLEGPAIQNHLEKYLAMMVERVLWSRHSGAALPTASPLLNTGV